MCLAHLFKRSYAKNTYEARIPESDATGLDNSRDRNLGRMWPAQLLTPALTAGRPPVNGCDGRYK